MENVIYFYHFPNKQSNLLLQIVHLLLGDGGMVG
jgi:hypothetical protein